jgi:hypothetical protein
MTTTIDGSAGVTTNSGAIYNGIQTSTVVPSTSGTAITFTNIPAWVKRITVMFDNVSLSGSDSFLIQIGPVGGLENTGYNGGGARLTVSSVGGATFTTGFGFNNVSSGTLYSGSVVLSNITGNTWTASGILGGSSADFASVLGGSKTLAGVLTQVSVTRSGTNTFDNGQINILYE